MEEYPDPDEEYEMMYQEELEMIRQIDDDYDCPRKSKRSLDFSSPKSSPSLLAPGNKGQACGAGVQIIESSSSLDVEINGLSSQNLNTNDATLSKEGSADPPLNDDNVPMSQEPTTLTDSILPSLLEEGKKRKVEDLFGDIADIEMEEFRNWLAKKKKTESMNQEEGFQDEELIRKIIEGRKQVQERLKVGRVIGRSQQTGNSVSGATNMTRRVPKWPFLPLVAPGGERWFVRLRSEQFMEEQINNIAVQGRTVGLLTLPYQTIWKTAQELIEKRLEREQTEIDAHLAHSLPESESKIEEEGSELWVDKYKPRSYLELLSDESTNRTLLQWLKLWDKVVFNRERKVRYNVVEVNASDDRSPEAFRLQLEAATQMRSVMGQDPRPNCLVLDEIDGAPAAAIELLVKFATGKDVGKGRGKKKASGAGLLKRPIICICNDVYVPALRPLRQLSLVVHFPPTASSRLAQRLLEIARKQHIRTDMTALFALAEKTHNDIRSCLGLLHFFKSQKKGVKLSDIQRSSVGQKDMQKGLFVVWQEIFQIQRPKQKLIESQHTPRDSKLEPMPDLNSPEMKFGNMALPTRMQSILRTVQSYGEYDRLMQGVYENFLKMNFKDSRLEGVSTGLDWFAYMDILNKEIRSQQNFVLMPYIPYAFVLWHFMFSSLAWPKLSYPSVGYEQLESDTGTSLSAPNRSFQLLAPESQPEKIPPKVVIVGAGIAGLSAAERLTQLGFHEYVVLEATRRPGGRVQSCWLKDTTTEFGGPGICESGIGCPSFRKAAQRDLLKDLLCDNCPATALADAGASDSPIDVAIRTRATLMFQDIEEEAELLMGQSCNTLVEDFLALRIEQELTRFPKNQRYNAARVMYGLSRLAQCVNTDPYVVSCEETERMFDCQLVDSCSAEIPEGHESLLTPLLQAIPKCNILYGKSVMQVIWGVTGVPNRRALVRCQDGQEFWADFVIITLPLGVLKRNVTRMFCPALPVSKIEAINNIGFSSASKFYLAYSSPLFPWAKQPLHYMWREEDLETRKDWTRGLQSLQQVPGSNHVLTGWVIGKHAEEMERLPEQEVLDATTHLLREATGDQSFPPAAILSRSKWCTDPHFCGAYTHLIHSTTPKHHTDLAAPVPAVCGVPPVLLFAGEATCPKHFSTVHGARLSGYREAENIFHVLEVHGGYQVPGQRDLDDEDDI
uniref:Amine oxidase domain-containing protein n=1 Tax=Timema tahoe TaxID=61484 RepID=A0A7R9NZ41_9NEOP|nr:unnamed protein product [Timema tahoe]